MSTGLKKKADMILSREQRMARAIALKAIRPRPFSVWEVMIPVIFIMGYMKAKSDREVFSQNILFTKKLALEAAYAMMREGQATAEALDSLDSKTRELLTAIPDGVYSEAIRQEQLKEMGFLMEHYTKLLQADGKDYDAMVLNAYPQREDYRQFHQALSALEKQVSGAATRTLGAQTDAAMLSRIESATDALRRAEVNRIFGSDEQG